MGKTKGRSLRLRNSKKRSKKNYEKNYRKNYKKSSIKKSKKNSKKYRKRSRKTKRTLRGVKRSMRMKGGTSRLKEQGISSQDTSRAGDEGGGMDPLRLAGEVDTEKDRLDREVERMKAGGVDEMDLMFLKKLNEPIEVTTRQDMQNAFYSGKYEYTDSVYQPVSKKWMKFTEWGQEERDKLKAVREKKEGAVRQIQAAIRRPHWKAKMAENKAVRAKKEGAARQIQAHWKGRWAEKEAVLQQRAAAKRFFSERNIPVIYWARILGAFERNRDLSTTWKTILEQVDGIGGGIMESVELREGQVVKVWSETAKELVYGHVVKVDDILGEVKVRYKIKVMKDGVKKNESRQTKKSIGDMEGLRWRFRGELGAILYPLIEVEYGRVKYLYDKINKVLYNLDEDVVADADYNGEELTNVKWREESDHDGTDVGDGTLGVEADPALAPDL